MIKFGSDAFALPTQEKSTAQIVSEKINCVELFIWADLSMNDAGVNRQFNMAISNFMLTTHVSPGFPENHRPQTAGSQRAKMEKIC